MNTAILAMTLAFSSTHVHTQTRVVPAPNGSTPAQDIELGRKAALDARKTLPLMHDDNVTSLVQDIGRRLVGAIPQNLGTVFLRFSREYERDADFEGAPIMARAGCDPNDMANMFKTIQKQAGSGGPQWLSDHPDPGDRSAYIAREAQSLQVTNPIRSTREFAQVQSPLK